MNWKKRVLAWICISAVTLSAFSCGTKTVTSENTVQKRITETKNTVSPAVLNKKAEDQKQVFSELTIRKDDKEFLADGKSAGNQYGDFIVHDDSSITVIVDGKEVSPEEAAEKTGCIFSENKDGSISVQAPFQTSQIIVKASRDFDNCNALSVNETIKDHFLLTYSSPSQAYSAYLKLSEDENIEYAEPNQILKSADIETNSRIESWGSKEIGVSEYLDELTGSGRELPEILVAVLDTGIYYEHNVFKGRIAEGSRNYAPGYSNDYGLDASDDEGHGSHCAGTICSATSDNVKILPIKVLDNSGYGDSYNTYCAMMYAIEQGADILSMSLGGYGRSHLIDEAVSRACQRDIFVCVSAGNEGIGSDDAYSMISANEKCIVVSSVDSSLSPSDFSNYQKVDFAAPGENILSVSLENPDAETEMSGTSMAAPFVTACLANILSYDSTVTAEEAYDILKANAIDLCEPGYDDKTGWGMVNLKNFCFSTEKNENVPTAPENSKTDNNDESLYSSDNFVIENGVLTYYNTENISTLDLAELVSQNRIPEFTAVGQGVFAQTNLTEVILPDSVTSIGDEAFSGSDKLKRVVTSAERIGKYAFERCYSLRELEDSNIRKIGNESFFLCRSLESADFSQLTEIPDLSFSLCRKITENSFCFDKITKLESGCFSDSGISGTIHLDSLVSAEGDVFSNTKIEEVYLPADLTAIPYNFFYGCNKLRYISAPSVTEIGNSSLALKKNGLTEENIVKTDIDFSGITYIGENAFDGYVFDGPVSFDSYTDSDISGFSGAYGESLSLPSVKVFNMTSNYSSSTFNVIYIENAEEINIEPDSFKCVIVTGSSLKKITKNTFYGNIYNDDIFFYSSSDDPDVLKLFEDKGLRYGTVSEPYLSDPYNSFETFNRFSMYAFLPGCGLKYSYTVKNCESGMVLKSVTDSDLPVDFIPYFSGEYEVELTVSDNSGNIICNNNINFYADDYGCVDTEENSCYEISPEDYYYELYNNNDEKILSFTPSASGEYQILSNWNETDIYSSDGTHSHFEGESSVIAELNADTEYKLVFHNSKYEDHLCISVNTQDNHRELLKDAADIKSAEIKWDTDNYKYTASLKRNDGTELEEGTDFLLYYSVTTPGSIDYTLKGIGKYQGYISSSCQIIRSAILNTPVSVFENDTIEFTPEKSGIYSIILSPQKSLISEAAENGDYISDFCISHEITVTDPDSLSPVSYKKMHPDKKAEYIGNTEIKLYLEEGKSYKIPCETGYDIIFTDRPSLSQCSISYTKNYRLTGDEVIPDISINDNGVVLKEGEDYILTVWNNTSPGTMFAVAEGKGKYSGFRTIAMAIEGGGIKAGESYKRDVMDIDPNEEFDSASCLLYRITFDSDAWIKIENHDNTLIKADLRKEDDLYGDGNTVYFNNAAEWIRIKKGTWIIRISPDSDQYTSYNSLIKNTVVKTSTDVKAIEDAEINIRYSKNGKPVVSVSFNGRTLAEGADYTLIQKSVSATGIGSADITGIGEYQGIKEIPYCTIPVSFTEDGILCDGQNSIDMSSQTRFRWTPEHSDYILSSTSEYTICDIIITDEKGNHIWSGTVSPCRDTEFSITPGKTYNVFVTGSFNDSFSILMETEGRLSDCTVEYSRYQVRGDSDSIPEITFRDGDHVLSEGTDYVLVNNGFINDTGRSEYVFKGTGSYFGEVTVPVIQYDEKISNFKDFTDAETEHYYSLSEYDFIGSKILLKITSDSENKTIYTLHKTGADPESYEYRNVFLYDSEGNFIAADSKAETFELSEGQTVYMIITSPYYVDNINAECSVNTKFILSSEAADKNTGTVLKGDVNCDGKVNVFDLIILQKYLFGTAELTSQGIINARMSENSECPSVIDYILLKSYLLS